MALKEVPNTLNRFETIIAYSWAYAKLIFQQVFSLLDSNISRITNRQRRKTTPYLVANKKVAALETAGLNTGVVDNKNYITSRFMARIAN